MKNYHYCFDTGPYIVFIQLLLHLPRDVREGCNNDENFAK